MSNPKANVEYVMRVKLPFQGPINADGGLDSEYRDAIFANLPEGFEVHWFSREEWPEDKDGMTWVRIVCTDQKRAVEYFNTVLAEARRKILRMQKLAEQIVD